MLDQLHREQRKIAGEIQRPGNRADPRLGHLPVHRRQAAEISDQRGQVLVGHQAKASAGMKMSGRPVAPHAVADRPLEVGVGVLADATAPGVRLDAGQPAEGRLVDP